MAEYSEYFTSNMEVDSGESAAKRKADAEAKSNKSKEPKLQKPGPMNTGANSAYLIPSVLTSKALGQLPQGFFHRKDDDAMSNSTNTTSSSVSSMGGDDDTTNKPKLLRKATEYEKRFKLVNGRVITGKILTWVGDREVISRARKDKKTEKYTPAVYGTTQNGKYNTLLTVKNGRNVIPIDARGNPLTSDDGYIWYAPKTETSKYNRSTAVKRMEPMTSEQKKKKTKKLFKISEKLQEIYTNLARLDRTTPEEFVLKRNHDLTQFESLSHLLGKTRL